MRLPSLYDNSVEESIENKSNSVLELCHFNLHAFPNLNTYANTLRSLVIIAQDIDEIGSLEECKLLENLWICETKVSKVHPVSSCVSLKNLHLYSNAITDVSGLETLQNLEVLWLNDNAIKTITPLYVLKTLKHLNLANNLVSEIHPSISNLVSLITLNLAGNLLCSIDTLKNLSCLKALEKIILEHAFYGSNPICSLQNYELLLICYCDSLIQLNEKQISSDVTQKAHEILYQKTKHFETLWQTKVTQYIKKVMMSNESVTKMSASLAYLVSYLNWVDLSQPSTPPQNAMALYHHHLKQIKDMHRQVKELYNQLVLEHSKLKISFFYLGNVEFVDTLPLTHATWLSKLPKLPSQSKLIFILYPFPYPDSPVELISLNNDLQLIVSSKLPCAFCLDHFAFQLNPPSVPHFISTEYNEYKSYRLSHLSNYLSEIQTSNLVELELKHMQLTSLPSSLCLPTIIKANLSFNMLSDLKPILNALPQLRTLNISYNHISHLPTTFPSQLKSIDFSGNRLSPASYLILQKERNQHFELIYDDYLVETPIQLFKDYFLFTDITNLVLDNAQLQEVDVLSSFYQVQVLSLRNNQLQNVDALAQLTHLEKLFLGGNTLKNIDVLASLTLLQVLDCSCNQIETLTLSGLRPFSNLTHFNLNANQSSSLKVFKQLTSLQELYFAYNQIQDATELHYLAHLPLLVLDLTDNPLSFAYYRPFLIYCIPTLQFLDGISVTDDEMINAKSLLVGCLTREKLLECMHLQRISMLTCLDLRGCQLIKLDCFTSGEFNALAYVNLDHNQFTEVNNLIHLRGLRCLSLNGNKLESLPETHSLDQPSLWPYLTELFLDQNYFIKLSDLHLTNASELRLLSLRGNRISRLDGIEHFTTVQKLFLDQNHVRHLDPDAASCLRSLKELSLNDNRLKNIRFIRFLPKLKYFFGERNRINSLSDLASHSLQGISLIGNPVARHLHYRVHLIHCLLSISRIDGTIVSDEERQRAKNTEAVGWQVTAPVVTTVTKQALRFSNVTLDGSELASIKKQPTASHFHLTYR